MEVLGRVLGGLGVLKGVFGRVLGVSRRVLSVYIGLRSVNNGAQMNPKIEIGRIPRQGRFSDTFLCACGAPLGRLWGAL